MKIRAIDIVKDYEGQEMFETEQDEQGNVKKTESPLTYRAIFFAALNNQERNEQLGAEKKAQIFQLTKKIFESPEPDLTVDERTLIKERTAKFFSPLIYGRISELFEEK